MSGVFHRPWYDSVLLCLAMAKVERIFEYTKKNGKIFLFSFHFPLIFLKKSSKIATNPRYLVPSLHQSDCHLSLAFQAGNEAHSACPDFL